MPHAPPAISLSSHYFQKLWAIQWESEALAHRGDRLPSAQELAERTGINVDLLTHLQTISRTAVSLDAVLYEDADFQLAEALADDTNNSELVSAERQEVLQLLLANLRPRERYVLDLRFGLAGNEAYSLTHVGRMLVGQRHFPPTA
jgi:RNA polymerase primary sigma factor